MIRRKEGLEGEVVRRRGSSWKGSRVRKYFVHDEKFRSEISRFQEGVIPKLKGLNLVVKLKLKLKRFEGVRTYVSRRVVTEGGNGGWCSTGSQG
jgi:hypothetical protein